MSVRAPQFLYDQPGLDRLAHAYLVGNQQARPVGPDQSHNGAILIGHEVNAPGPQRIQVGGRRREQMQAGQMGAQVVGTQQRGFVGTLKGPQLALVVGGLTIVLEHPVASLGGAGHDSDDRHYSVRIGAQRHEVADLEHRSCGPWSDGGHFEVARRRGWFSGVGGIERGIAGRVGRHSHVGKGMFLDRFNRRDGGRRGTKHVQNAGQGISIPVEILIPDRRRRQVRPSVAHGLQFPDPGASLARQIERLRELVPILVEDAQQGGKIQLFQPGEPAFFHGALLLEAQAVCDMRLPPVRAKGRQVSREKGGKLGGSSANQFMHGAEGR